jgi:hypothetical protein
MSIALRTQSRRIIVPRPRLRTSESKDTNNSLILVSLGSEVRISDLLQERRGLLNRHTDGTFVGATAKPPLPILRFHPATVPQCAANCSAPRSDNARIV